MFKFLEKYLHKKYAMALTIVIVTIAAISGAWRISDDKAVPINNPEEVYNRAVSQLSAAESIYYKVTGTRMISDNGITSEERFTQLITYEKWGTNNFRGCVEEDLQIGTQNIKSFEFFSEGTAYFTTQGASYQSEMTADDYTCRYAPVVPVDSSLYAQITGFKSRKSSTICFSKTGVVASWIGASGITLVDATATATLSPKGSLLSSSYCVTYSHDGTTITLDIAVEILDKDPAAIQLPDSSVYTPIADISVPKTLERSCGYLTAIQDIHSVYADTIFCEAFGDQRTQTVTLSTSGDDGFSAEVDTTVSVTNSGKAGVVTTSTKKELFEKNAYSYAMDGVTFENDTNVSEAEMQNYCDNLLIGTILLPDCIGAVDVTESDNFIIFSFLPTNEFANILAQDACLSLYQNATILMEQALSSKTNDVTCYLTINKVSGYPISSGFYYSGTYNISGIPYQLSFKADQTYDYVPPSIVNEKGTD